MALTDQISNAEAPSDLERHNFDPHLLGEEAFDFYRRRCHGKLLSLTRLCRTIFGVAVPKESKNSYCFEAFRYAFVRAACSGRSGDAFWGRMQRAALGNSLLCFVPHVEDRRKIAGLGITSMRRVIANKGVVHLDFDAGDGYYLVAVGREGYLGDRKITPEGSFSGPFNMDRAPFSYE